MAAVAQARPQDAFIERVGLRRIGRALGEAQVEEAIARFIK
jgi:hypothetical protein